MARLLIPWDNPNERFKANKSCVCMFFFIKKKKTLCPLKDSNENYHGASDRDERSETRPYLKDPHDTTIILYHVCFHMSIIIIIHKDTSYKSMHLKK